MEMREINGLAKRVTAAVYKIHSRLGPGLSEDAYASLLTRELRQQGIKVEREKKLPISFEGLEFTRGLRVDLLIEGELVVELKCVRNLTLAHVRQLLTYLRVLNRRLGLLINFSAPVMKHGIRRVINGYDK